MRWLLVASRWPPRRPQRSPERRPRPWPSASSLPVPSPRPAAWCAGAWAATARTTHPISSAPRLRRRWTAPGMPAASPAPIARPARSTPPAGSRAGAGSQAAARARRSRCPSTRSPGPDSRGRHRGERDLVRAHRFGAGGLRPQRSRPYPPRGQGRAPVGGGGASLCVTHQNRSVWCGGAFSHDGALGSPLAPEKEVKALGGATSLAVEPRSSAEP